MSASDRGVSGRAVGVVTRLGDEGGDDGVGGILSCGNGGWGFPLRLLCVPVVGIRRSVGPFLG